MFAIKKNQIVITALVVMIAAAGYLNYVDSKASKSSEVVLNDEGDIYGLIPDSDLYGDPIYNSKMAEANKSETEPVSTNNSSSNDAGTAVFVNSSNDTSYFIQAKLEREQARAKQKDILTEMMNNDNVEQNKKSEAADEMLKIQERIEKETAAEAMIEAKGFKEVYVRIDDDTVDVVINKAELNEAEIAQIEDIVKRKTGVSVDKIRISPIKK